MISLDKDRFGAFVAGLRKEKQWTQKQLAERLGVSDKAVSKWETAHSLPDISLLMPLAETLGVTVTELLECRRIEEPLETAQVEAVVKTALTLTETEGLTARRRRWVLWYGVCLALGCVETALLYHFGVAIGSRFVVPLLSAVFGLYACGFAREQLPGYYDTNRINAYSDGPFRLNLPGVAFHNSNWPYILRVIRMWSLAGMALYPLLIPLPVPEYVTVVAAVGGLFLPLYVVAKKYE